MENYVSGVAGVEHYSRQWQGRTQSSPVMGQRSSVYFCFLFFFIPECGLGHPVQNDNHNICRSPCSAAAANAYMEGLDILYCIGGLLKLQGCVIGRLEFNTSKSMSDRRDSHACVGRDPSVTCKKTNRTSMMPCCSV